MGNEIWADISPKPAFVTQLYQYRNILEYLTIMSMQIQAMLTTERQRRDQVMVIRHDGRGIVREESALTVA